MKTKNPVQTFSEGISVLQPPMAGGAGDQAAGAVTAVRPPGLSGHLHIYTAVLCFALFEQDCLGDDRWTELPRYLAIKIFSPAQLI